MCPSPGPPAPEREPMHAHRGALVRRGRAGHVRGGRGLAARGSLGARARGGRRARLGLTDGAASRWSTARRGSGSGPRTGARRARKSVLSASASRLPGGRTASRAPDRRCPCTARDPRRAAYGLGIWSKRAMTGPTVRGGTLQTGLTASNPRRNDCDLRQVVRVARSLLARVQDHDGAVFQVVDPVSGLALVVLAVEARLDRPETGRLTWAPTPAGIRVADLCAEVHVVVAHVRLDRAHLARRDRRVGPGSSSRRTRATLPNGRSSRRRARWRPRRRHR